MVTNSNVSVELTNAETLNEEGEAQSYIVVMDATGETMDLSHNTETNSKLCDLPQDFVIQKEVQHNGK